MDGPVAARLAAAHPGRVGPLVRRFDSEGGYGPGWLVKAIEEGWPAAVVAVKGGGLLTHAEMLDRWRQLGGGDATGRSTAELFETVDTPDGKRWREK